MRLSERVKIEIHFHFVARQQYNKVIHRYTMRKFWRLDAYRNDIDKFPYILGFSFMLLCMYVYIMWFLYPRNTAYTITTYINIFFFYVSISTRTLITGSIILRLFVCSLLNIVFFSILLFLPVFWKEYKRFKFYKIAI